MSSSVNKVMLLGNATRDPEIKYTPKGTAIADIGMAVNRTYSVGEGDHREKREEVTFVDITFWGRPAEILGEYVKKGHSFHVEGYLKLDQWDDKQTGAKRSKLKVVGEQLTLLNNKRVVENEEADAGAGQRSSYQPRQQPAERPSQQRPPPPPQKRPPADPDLDAPEDDIPF